MRRPTLGRAFPWFDRHSQKQNVQQVVPDIPVRQSDPGPSKLGVGILLSAAVLLLATWHRLTARGPSNENEMVALEEDNSARSLGDALDAEAAFQQKTIAEQLQARMEQAKARVRNAPLEDRASIVREEVQKLKALRQMASELYSYNAMSLEAEEMRSQLADLKLQQDSHSSAASTATATASDSALVDDGLLEERRVSGVSAGPSAPIHDSSDAHVAPRGDNGTAQTAADNGRKQIGEEGTSMDHDMLDNEETAVLRDEGQESEEVAELASRMWNSAEVSHDKSMNEARNGHSALEREAEVAESSVDEAESAVLQLEILAGGVNLPHPAKQATGGEDAFFTSTVHGGAVGVADGVSGWSREGIDAALYSRKLMRHAQEGVEMGLGCREGAVGVLNHANSQTDDTDGSTTAVIAVMHPPNVCEIASIGDSGFRLVREGQCIFASEAQQHSFNCPFQLASQKRYPEANSPDDADVYEVSLLPGDILVLGSDGLFDNMWDSQLEAIVREHMQAQPHRTAFTAEALARMLAQAARINALDAGYQSPFIMEAAAAGVLPIWRRWNPRGGKLDDCTVVVVFAEPAQAPNLHSQPHAGAVPAAA
ncbi:probable protein phosphatase 2C 26 at C-terminar half [Coccomyxa sp. Obi]|nr:probable protein phosphatase 2C 26 at C-terminar half [Coccomyxa sp. Obi]